MVEQDFLQPPSDAAYADSMDKPARELLGRWGIVAVALLGLAAAVGLTLGPSLLRRAESEATSTGEAPPPRTLSIARPKPTQDATLSLPANIDAFQSTLIYARVNGYMRIWYADLGDRVKKGQVLAEIDTPDMDQDLTQARSNLAQGQADLDTAIAELQEAQDALVQAEANIARAKADSEFAQGTHRRNVQLVAQHAVADQDVDQSLREREMRKADLDAAMASLKTRQSTVITNRAKIKSREASIKSLEASVRRLEEMQTFKAIVAPFDGTVTRRRAEVGMLVTAGSAAGSQDLFAVAQADTLRIRITVPQSHAMAIQIGQSARVLVPEFPDHERTAKVARTAQAIDPVSRTLLVELELPNADHALLPGTFAQVTLATRQTDPTWTVPAAVLLSRAEGLQVALVDDRGVVRLRKVKLGRDFGRSVEVVAGLHGDESLVVNPPDDLAEGEKATIADGKSGTGGASGTQRGASVAAHEARPRS